jgi:predicted ester cyclase
MELSMSEENTVVCQQFLDLYNQGAWDQLDGMVSANYIHHNKGNQLTLERFKRGAAWFRAGMPDFHIDVLDLAAAADKVFVRWVGRGTHLGSFYGETVTSKTIAINGITEFRVQNNLIMEDWEAMDELDFMKQVGASAQAG